MSHCSYKACVRRSRRERVPVLVFIYNMTLGFVALVALLGALAAGASARRDASRTRGAFIDSCLNVPNLPTNDSVNLQAYSGVWWKTLMSKAIYELGQRDLACISPRFSLPTKGADGLAHINITEWSRKGGIDGEFHVENVTLIQNKGGKMTFFNDWMKVSKVAGRRRARTSSNRACAAGTPDSTGKCLITLWTSSRTRARRTSMRVPCFTRAILSASCRACG